MTVSVKEYLGDFIAANGLFEDDERPVLPEATVTPDSIKAMMTNEVSPKNPADDFYTAGTPDYMATTKTLFKSAGIDIETAAIFLIERSKAAVIVEDLEEMKALL